MRNDNKMLLSAPTNGSIHLDTHTFWFKNTYKDKFAREQWRYLYLLFLSNKKSACGIFIDLDFIQEFRMRYTSTYYVIMKRGLWEIKAGARHSHSLNDSPSEWKYGGCICSADTGLDGSQFQSWCDFLPRYMTLGKSLHLWVPRFSHLEKDHLNNL